MKLTRHQDLNYSIEKAIKTVKITDIHTHLFSQNFGDFFLYGIDELLTYHYLIAETFRLSDIPYEKFENMSKKEQAEFVWKTLFVENTPLSEVTRSIIAIFDRLGIDVNNKDLNYYRSYFTSRKLGEYTDYVFEKVGLDCVVMTNDPFDDKERAIWENSYEKDTRFKAALRLDALLTAWDKAYVKLKTLSYDVAHDFSGKTFDEIQRFLNTWIDKMEALYCAVSLPPTFCMNDGSPTAKIIENCVLPVCLSRNIPFGLMIGVKRRTNPCLSLAGDSVGRADISNLEYLCSNYPHNKFLVTMLSLENQHELIVTARKFKNLMIFGCWWFINNPSLIENITRLRIEMLGTSFIPQHSDCRVFEQLISKWDHSKDIITKVLIEKYSQLLESGYSLTYEQLTSDIEKLFGGNFWWFLKAKF